MLLYDEEGHKACELYVNHNILDKSLLMGVGGGKG